MFAKCLTSVHSQDDPDYEHVILEDRIGIGVAGANKMFYNNRHLVTGEYVYMLDDDDVLTTPDFISDMKAIIREHNNPGIIFIRGYINDELHPTLPCWESDRMYQNRVDTQCFVVRHDLWQAHISNFGAPRCGDFFFIDSVFKTKPVVVWHDRTYFKTLKVSRGADE